MFDRRSLKQIKKIVITHIPEIGLRILTRKQKGLAYKAAEVQTVMRPLHPRVESMKRV